MLTPRRRYSAQNSYRYGFNGKENDNEVKGEGDQQDYGMRIYDPRLGKFLSVDPLSKSYPWMSTYAFAENSPIMHIDLDGGEKMPYYDLPKHSANTQLEVINHVNVYTFTELNTQYKVAEYGTQLKDPGPFNSQYPRSVYMVKDEKVVNNSDYIVGDGTIIRTKGTNWHYWKTSNDRSTAGEVTDDLLRKTGIAVFGGAVAGTALPAATFLNGSYWGSKFVSSGIDFASQMATNGGDISKVNLTSLATSFVFNQTTSLKGLLLKNTIANGLQYNASSGYTGFFGKGVDNSNVAFNIAFVQH